MGTRGQKSGAISIHTIHTQSVAKIVGKRTLVNSIVSGILRYEGNHNIPSSQIYFSQIS